MKNPVSVILLLTLASCANAAKLPVVDMAGVDIVKHNRDLAECEELRRNTFFSVGPPMANCMKEKGYKILIN